MFALIFLPSFKTNINCGGCDSPNDSSDANCVACGGNSSGGGGPPPGGGGGSLI